jgi:CBS domain-containing protein
MAEAALQARPALNRFGGFATGDPPNAPGTLNLKLQGARIFIDAARIYALAHGMAHTNTADRLRAVRDALGLSETDASAAVEAFYLVQGLRLRNQVSRQTGDPETANCIALESLGRISQAALKEALRTAKDLQSRLALDYQL